MGTSCGFRASRGVNFGILELRLAPNKIQFNRPAIEKEIRKCD